MVTQARPPAEIEVDAALHPRKAGAGGDAGFAALGRRVLLRLIEEAQGT